MNWNKTSLLRAADFSRRFCGRPFNGWVILLGVDQKDGYVYAVPTTDAHAEFADGIIKVGKLFVPSTLKEVITAVVFGWHQHLDREARLSAME